jgi:GT2 family glycosyltransferase
MGVKMNYLGIPTIDSYDYLVKTLSTIKTAFPFRILVVNNGQPLPFLDKIANVNTIINNRKNSGISVSWNQIIKWALSYDDCESIFILNDDIELHPDCIDIMLNSLYQYDITGAYETKDLDVVKEPRWVGGVHFSCFAMTPNIPRAIGYFDEAYTPFHVEDTDYWKRLIEAGFKSGTDRTAKFIHHKVRPRGEAKRWEEGGKVYSVREIHNRNRAYFRKKHGCSPKEWYGRSVEGSRR